MPSTPTLCMPAEAPMQPNTAPSMCAEDEAKTPEPAEATPPPVGPLAGKADVSEPGVLAPGAEMSSTPAESSTGNDGAENEAIAGDGELPTPAVPPPTQLEATQDGRQTPDTAEAKPPPAAPLPGKKKTRGDAIVSGRAAANAYWKKLGQEGGLNVSTVKHVFSTIRNVALQDLKEKGKFRVHGICDLEVKEERKHQTKKRDADEPDPKARPARKKIKAKVSQELSQLFTQK